MNFSSQQEEAIKQVKAWLKDPNGPQVFRIFGFAGTGKTFLAKFIAGEVKGTVLFAAFTGKAAMVLRQKGCDGATTIHALIYTPEPDTVTGEVRFILNTFGDLSEADLLIVDEVSMVGPELGGDLLSFKKRILVLGDPAQLPSIEGQGFFINGKPDVMLTEVHRQALDNPIIQMSMQIRQGKRLQPGTYGQSRVIERRSIDRDQLSELIVNTDQVLCGLNKTRVSFNKRIRELKGLVGKDEPYFPVAGDRLICLKNNRQKHIFNGGIWEVDSIKNKRTPLQLRLRSLDEERNPLDVKVFENFFEGTEKDLDWRTLKGTEQFTFGWAITCHKSQGSAWDDVLVYDQGAAFEQDRFKWSYTAVTRAAERVTVLI